MVERKIRYLLERRSQQTGYKMELYTYGRAVHGTTGALNAIQIGGESAREAAGRNSAQIRLMQGKGRAYTLDRSRSWV